MNQNDGRRIIAENHAADLLGDEQSVQMKLSQLRTLSRIAVILGVIAPILAGSTVAAAWLNDRSYWPIATGMLTLVASAGVALHKGLDCDRYHAKCSGALAELRSLAAGYDRLLSGAQVERRDDFEALEVRLDKFYVDYADVLPLRPTRLNLPVEIASRSRPPFASK